MAEHRLKPLSPLGRPDPEATAIGAFRIAERTDVALGSLAARAGREAEVEALAEGAGIPLPGPGRAAGREVWAAFWLSPAQWMVEAPFATHEDIVAHLKPIFGDAASITEQTDAWVRFDVTGPLQSLFERLCNLDIARMEPGAATRTLIEHVGVHMVRRAPDATSVLGPRSSAASLHHALLTAARSVS